MNKKTLNTSVLCMCTYLWGTGGRGGREERTSALNRGQQPTGAVQRLGEGNYEKQ